MLLLHQRPIVEADDDADPGRYARVGHVQSGRRHASLQDEVRRARQRCTEQFQADGLLI